MAPDATAVLVKMRGALLSLLPEHRDLRQVDTDLKHQFVSWFNRGFLELRVIDVSRGARDVGTRRVVCELAA